MHNMDRGKNAAYTAAALGVVVLIIASLLAWRRFERDEVNKTVANPMLPSGLAVFWKEEKRFLESQEFQLAAKSAFKIDKGQYVISEEGIAQLRALAESHFSDLGVKEKLGKIVTTEEVKKAALRALQNQPLKLTQTKTEIIK